MTGKEWLALNDPCYVSPQAKAAKTREIPVDPLALAAILGGTGLRRVGGKTVQCLAIGFEGDEGTITPFAQPGQIKRTYINQPIRRRGKRGGRKHR